MVAYGSAGAGNLFIGASFTDWVKLEPPKAPAGVGARWPQTKILGFVHNDRR